MDIEDSSPERRNLIVTSLAFIVYYGAGGSMASDHLQLMMVDVRFERPEFIAVLAWVLLGWFALRFFQKAGFPFWKQLKEEVGTAQVPTRLARLSAAQAKTQLMDLTKQFEDFRIVAARVIAHEQPWSVLCEFHGPDGIYHQELVPIAGVFGAMYKAWFVGKAIISENAWSESALPYILFVCAVLAPAWSCLL